MIVLYLIQLPVPYRTWYAGFATFAASKALVIITRNHLGPHGGGGSGQDLVPCQTLKQEVNTFPSLFVDKNTTRR